MFLSIQPTTPEPKKSPVTSLPVGDSKPPEAVISLPPASLPKSRRERHSDIKIETLSDEDEYRPENDSDFSDPPNDPANVVYFTILNVKLLF